jgi:RNA polymerase sigma-70 factor, ECF subfamily
MTVEFDQLIQQNIGRIRRIAQRYAAVGEVEDLCQEICMALWRSFATFRGESSIDTWLYRIALNTAMTSVRRLVRNREKHETLQRANSGEGAAPEGMSQVDILNEFIASLNEVDASVLLMYLDGLTGEQIGQVLGIKANAIGVRVNRIKEKFSATYVD